MLLLDGKVNNRPLSNPTRLGPRQAKTAKQRNHVIMKMAIIIDATKSPLTYSEPSSSSTPYNKSGVMSDGRPCRGTLSCTVYRQHSRNETQARCESARECESVKSPECQKSLSAPWKPNLSVRSSSYPNSQQKLVISSLCSAKPDIDKCTSFFDSDSPDLIIWVS